MNYEIWKVDFPQITLPIDIGPGTGQVNVSNLNIQAFNSPKFYFNLAPPNGIVWRSVVGSTCVTGHWQAVYHILGPVSLL